MIRIYPILVRERFRRFIKSIKQRPLISISLLISIIVIIKDLFTEAYDVSVILNNQIVVLFVMIYLVAKIINPTQGMTIDYQERYYQLHQNNSKSKTETSFLDCLARKAR